MLVVGGSFRIDSSLLSLFQKKGSRIRFVGNTKQHLEKQHCCQGSKENGSEIERQIGGSL